MRNGAVYLVVAIIAALALSAPATGQDAYGVIAVGEIRKGDGVAYGFAWNLPAKDAAHAEAMDACTSSGGTDCIEAVWFQNGCAALAIDQHGIVVGKPAMTQEQAEARALQSCKAEDGKGCSIAGSLCTAPDGKPGTYSGSEKIHPVQRAQTTTKGPGGEPLTRAERVLVQQSLNALGFDAGPADGIFGRRTRSAIWEWQKASDHEATGQVTREQYNTLTARSESPGETKQFQQEAAGNQSNKVLYFPEAETGEGLSPNCTAMGEGWTELANKPGCFAHGLGNDNPVAWSGACSGCVAVGQGTLRWKGGQSTGKMEWGKSHGRWEIRYDNGDVFEGTFKDGTPHGRWVKRWGNGTVFEGILRNNEAHGRWVKRWGDGRVEEGTYKDGKKHGRWVERGPERDGERRVFEGTYKDGKKHGGWVEREPDRFGDGHVAEGPYKDGERHGRWVTRRPDGYLYEGSYKDGKKHGRWVEHGPRYVESNNTGFEREGPYRDGKRHGRWVERYPERDGARTVDEGTYKDGKKHGRWVRRNPNYTPERVTVHEWTDGSYKFGRRLRSPGRPLSSCPKGAPTCPR